MPAAAISCPEDGPWAESCVGTDRKVLERRFGLLQNARQYNDMAAHIGDRGIWPDVRNVLHPAARHQL